MTKAQPDLQFGGCMDLNLVRVFVTIYETRSLTLAGERLFVTQSAVSQALGKLRTQLDDPLFERVGRLMRPTPLADSVFPRFREAISQVDQALDDVRGFEAATSDRGFRIALSELGEIGWVSELFEAVHAEAPRARIEVVPLDVERLPEWLERGTVDLAITPVDLPGSFEHTVVKHQTYGVVMSSDNPLAKGPITAERYVAALHAVVASDSGAPLLREAMRRADIRIEPRVQLQHFASLSQLLAGSRELIATIPEAIAVGWASKWAIEIRELPFEMTPIELRLYQRKTTQHKGALKWFYATVARALEGSEGKFASIHAQKAGK
jgi:DNA-binding transcriptional LysR family regulator